MLQKWSSEVESLCEKLRINCVNLSEYHRRRYYHFKSYGKYFRLPIIILASINSTASVGLQPVLAQAYISGITCFIGMVMGILGAIELYMGIQSSMELELKQSKEFYSLAIDLYKTLRLRPTNRGEDGKDYLNKKYNVYIKICEASNLLKRKLKIDLLTTIPVEFIDKSRATTPYKLENADGTTRIILKENKTIWEYICCCLENADNSSNTYISGNPNLELYNFPNLEAGLVDTHRMNNNNNNDYDDNLSEDDIERQYAAYRTAESSKSLIAMGYEPDNMSVKSLTNEASLLEPKEQPKEETKEQPKEETKEENVILEPDTSMEEKTDEKIIS